MAEILDDGEFWLPPQFLTDDDDFSVDYRAANLKNKGEFGLVSDSATDKGSFFSFDSTFGGYGSFWGSSSDFSSPVESVVGSTETESDEEDTFVSKMARSKVGNISRSPQSTLCSVGSGCLCRHGSSGGSPNGPCQVSSPLATWDLLYAAAGEVAKMSKNNEEAFGLNQSNMVPPRKPSPIGVPVKNLKSESELSQQRLQIAQFQIWKQQQQNQAPGIWGGQMKGTGHFQPLQVVQNRARNNDFIGGGGQNRARPLGLSPSAWPPLQQAQPQNGSGMRAMFLGEPPTKRECAGTGVFLPRRNVGVSESRKKPGACSTVLLPDRVVQALNLNLDEMGAQAKLQPRFNGTKTAEIGKAAPQISHSRRRSNNLRPPAVINAEIQLPQEWTY